MVGPNVYQKLITIIFLIWKIYRPVRIGRMGRLQFLFCCLDETDTASFIRGAGITKGWRGWRTGGYREIQSDHCWIRYMYIYKFNLSTPVGFYREGVEQCTYARDGEFLTSNPKLMCTIMCSCRDKNWNGKASGELFRLWHHWWW